MPKLEIFSNDHVRLGDLPLITSNSLTNAQRHRLSISTEGPTNHLRLTATTQSTLADDLEAMSELIEAQADESIEVTIYSDFDDEEGITADLDTTEVADLIRDAEFEELRNLVSEEADEF